MRVVLAVVLALAGCTTRTPLPEASADAGAAMASDASPAAVADASRDPEAGPDAAFDAGARDGGAPRGRMQTGEATWYATDGRGTCGLPVDPNDLDVAAISVAQYSRQWCGRCVLVTGPKGTVKVRIVDACPACAHGGLDLSAQAFAKIASLGDGRVRVRWQIVTC